VLRLDFRDYTRLGEHVPVKMPKIMDLKKLEDQVNLVTINRIGADLIYKTQGLCTQIGKLMALHTEGAESVYLKRTYADIIENRRQALIDYEKHTADEAEKKRKREEEDAAVQRAREEEDAIAAATQASLEEAAGVKSKSRKRRRGG